MSYLNKPVVGSLSFVVLLFTALFAVDIQPVFAQNDVPEILITPSRFKKKSKQNSRAVQVIDSEQIKRSNSRNVIDLLRRSVGMDVVQAGGLGRSSSAFIRGAESDHTLVLIDGIRVNDPNVGSFDLADLQLDSIEKIEIIRGASSAAYGSEAIGGVINIITKELTKEASGKVNLQGGSYGTHSESLNLSDGGDSLANSLSLSYLGSDGISAANGSRGNSEKDQYENISLSTRSKLKTSEKTNISLNTRSLSSKTDFDGFDFTVGAIDDPNFYQKRDLVTAGLFLESELAPTLNLKSEINFTNEKIEGKDTNDVFNNYNIRGENRFASLAISKEFDKNNLTSLGFDYLNRKAVNKTNFVQHRDTVSFWAEHTLTIFEDFTTNVGVRAERNNDFGSVFVYDVSPMWRLDTLGSNLHSSIGTGYKAPSFNELYFPNFGNADLDPEKSRSYDLGIKKYLCESMWLDTTFFYNDFEDLITFDSTTFLAANIAEAKAKGVETQVGYEFSKMSGVNFNYVYTDTKDKSTGMSLARRARHKAGIQFYLSPIENLDLSTSFTLANSRRESTREKMDNYELVDLSMSYWLAQNRKLFLRADNLLDEDYEELPGYGVAGFSVYAGVEFGLF
jgi:vitamin B12 transporter